MELNGNLGSSKELSGTLSRKASLSGTIRRSSGGGTSYVFWATYDETSQAEIAEAVSSGKVVSCLKTGKVYQLLYAGSLIVFSCFDTESSYDYLYLRYLTVQTSTWSSGSIKIPKKAYVDDALADKVDIDQGVQYSGKFLAVGNDGKVAPKDAPPAVIPSGAVDSSSTATAFTATVSGITALTDGVCVWLKNGVVTSAAGCTLDINSLGAKPIYASQSAATAITTQFNINYTALLIYNSTRVTNGCWDYVYGYETNTTYTPVKLGFGYATCDTAAATSAKTASLSSYTLNTNGIVAVKFTNAVGAGATLNINSKGAKDIYYRGAAITAGVIEAGDTATFIYSTRYHLIALDKAGGGSITVDSALSTSSTNPVQNKVITDAIDETSVQMISVDIGGTYQNYYALYQRGVSTPFLVPMVGSNTGTVNAYVLPDATQSAKGAMSAADKAKLDGLSSEVFWATYGTTTLAELQAAWADGKTILIYYQGNVYYLSSVTGNNNSSFVFRCPNWSTNGRAQLYEVMNSYDTWSYSAYEGSDYILAPSSPATGAFLVWNGSAWTAQTLSTWQGGSY